MDIKYAVSMAAINDIAQHGGSRYLAGGAVGGGGHRGAKGVSGGRVEKPRKSGDRAPPQHAPTSRRSVGQVPTAAELDREMEKYMDQRDK